MSCNFVDESGKKCPNKGLKTKNPKVFLCNQHKETCDAWTEEYHDCESHVNLCFNTKDKKELNRLGSKYNDCAQKRKKVNKQCYKTEQKDYDDYTHDFAYYIDKHRAQDCFAKICDEECEDENDLEKLKNCSINHKKAEKYAKKKQKLSDLVQRKFKRKLTAGERFELFDNHHELSKRYNDLSNQCSQKMKTKKVSPVKVKQEKVVQKKSSTKKTPKKKTSVKKTIEFPNLDSLIKKQEQERRRRIEELVTEMEAMIKENLVIDDLIDEFVDLKKGEPFTKREQKIMNKYNLEVFKNDLTLMEIDEESNVTEYAYDLHMILERMLEEEEIQPFKKELKEHAVELIKKFMKERNVEEYPLEQIQKILKL